MGCLSSKEAVREVPNPSPSGPGAGVSPLDPPPDFGLGEQYEVRKLLGEGGSGQTWLCRDMQQRKMVAIKFIKRAIPRIVLPMLMHEIKIQAELGDGHVNLVSAKAVVLTDTHLGIVMEYASGGNLTNYVTDKWETAADRDGLFLTEDEARFFFRQYIDAVEFLHANHVAHRDLKLDNIVLDGSNPPRIKVCDFGFAKNWEEEANMFTQIGTPVYMCPQLISCKHNSSSYDATKADIWACGVLLFVMLLGAFPYDHTEHPDPNSSDAHVEVWLQQTKFSWRESPTVAEGARKLSLECQDLLDKMFERDESRRITIARIKEHRWFKKKVPEDLQLALDKINEEQSQRVSTTASKAVGHRAMGAKRGQELLDLLEEAGTEEHGHRGPPIFKRIDLTRIYDDDDAGAGPSTSSPAPVASARQEDKPTTSPSPGSPRGSAGAASPHGGGPQLQNGSAGNRTTGGGATNGGGVGSPAAGSASPVQISSPKHQSDTAAIASDQVTVAVAGKDEQCAQAVISSEVPSVKAVAAAQ